MSMIEISFLGRIFMIFDEISSYVDAIKWNEDDDECEWVCIRGVWKERGSPEKPRKYPFACSLVFCC